MKKRKEKKNDGRKDETNAERRREEMKGKKES